MTWPLSLSYPSTLKYRSGYYAGQMEGNCGDLQVVMQRAVQIPSGGLET